MPKFIHNLSDLVAQLDTKIAALQEKQAAIQGALGRNVNIPVNTVALQKITVSLVAAQGARAGMQVSCCNQNCEIDYDDAATGGPV